MGSREWSGSNVHRTVAVILYGLDLDLSSTHFELLLVAQRYRAASRARCNGARGQRVRGFGFAQ